MSDETKQPESIAQAMKGWGVETVGSGLPKTVKMLVHAQPGVGKTMLITTLLRAGYRVLFWDWDNGVTTLTKFMRDTPLTPDGKPWPLARMTFSAFSPQAGQRNMQRATEVLVDLPTDLTRDVLVVDSISVALRTLEAELDGEWAPVSGAGRRWIDTIARLRCNVVLTAWSKVKTSGKGKDKSQVAEPDIIPSIQNEIMGLLDVVLFMSANDRGDRSLRSGHSSGWLAKDRTQTLKPVMPADLAEIIRLTTDQNLPAAPASSPPVDSQQKTSDISGDENPPGDKSGID